MAYPRGGHNASLCIYYTHGTLQSLPLSPRAEESHCLQALHILSLSRCHYGRVREFHWPDCRCLRVGPVGHWEIKRFIVVMASRRRAGNHHKLPSLCIYGKVCSEHIMARVFEDECIYMLIYLAIYTRFEYSTVLCSKFHWLTTFISALALENVNHKLCCWCGRCAVTSSLCLSCSAIICMNKRLLFINL